MTAITEASTPLAEASTRVARRRRSIRAGSAATQVFMIVVTVAWITPIVFALYVALRPQSETNKLG